MSIFSTAGTTAPPRAAATVVLLREVTGASGDAVEVLLLRRHAKSTFMGGSYVFPGGAVDDSDRAFAEALPAGVSAALALRLEPAPGPFQPAAPAAFFVAALRELWEEAGIALVKGVNRERAPEQLRAARTALNGQDLRPVLEEAQLTPDFEALRPFAHWVTPSGESRRYDTWFFLAALPPNQTSDVDQREATQELWVSPAAALEAHAAQRIVLPPPTLYNLARLAGATRFSDAEARLVSRPIPAILPRLLLGGGDPQILLPWDRDYGAQEGEGHPLPAPHVGAPSRVLRKDGLWVLGSERE